MESERYFLPAFIAEGRSLSLDTLPDWGSNVPGVAVVQRCSGATPNLKTIIKGVCLQRIEVRPTTNRQGLVYIAVIQATNLHELSFSHDMPPLEWALRQLKEVYLIWSRVPPKWMHCSACDARICSRGAVFFEKSLPVCSAFCTLLNKQF
jgi:hypothetical protein